MEKAGALHDPLLLSGTGEPRGALAEAGYGWR